MKNALPWIGIPVALAIGFLVCWLIVVVPAGHRADALLADARAKYSAAQGQLESASLDVAGLTATLATKDSELLTATAGLRRARNQVDAIAEDFKRFRDAIDSGSLGLGDDAKALGQIVDLIKTSITVAGRLQAGDRSGR